MMPRHEENTILNFEMSLLQHTRNVMFSLLGGENETLHHVVQASDEAFGGSFRGIVPFEAPDDDGWPCTTLS